MKTLTKKQQKAFEEELRDLAEDGIEIGKSVELWRHPDWYRNGILVGKETRSPYLEYQDQFGISHLALLAEKHFAVIREITAEDSCGDDVSVKILAEADNMWFKTRRYTNNGEWEQFNHEMTKQEGVFCRAERAFNSNILLLDEDGKIPVPKDATICPKHGYAYIKNRSCRVCDGNADVPGKKENPVIR